MFLRHTSWADVSVPSKFGPIVQVRKSDGVTVWYCVSVPSKFGPIVQDGRLIVEILATVCFSTLEVRANRASVQLGRPVVLILLFQYPRSSGQSCKVLKIVMFHYIYKGFSTLEVRANRASATFSAHIF